MLVIGGKGHGAFTGMPVGSVALKLVHHAACPVVVVR
ncbi:universal stress protein [Saccharopolyspora sp. ASAGF58]|nr:universal stress protein [Saccharopolyspora sp. ASAGF58]